MSYTRIIAASFLFASLGWAGAHAQTLSQNPTPAEFPPASFQGNQYVDSAGCVFIRAGIDGNVTWVPRVNRSRQQVCGARPSNAGSAAAAAQPAPAAAPVQIVPRATTPAPAPTATATTTIRRPATATTPRRTTRQPMPTVATTLTRRPTTTQAPKTQPKRTVKPAAVVVPRRQAPKPSPAPKPTLIAPSPKPAAPTTTLRGQGNRCSNASAFSQQYINDGSRFPVRCGPQAESPVTRPSGSSSRGSGGGERILPAHLLDERRQASIVRVPEGYEPVWTDGRLNPKRAEQSVNGYIATQYGWSNTVPRSGDARQRGQRIKQPKIISNEPQSTRAFRPVFTSNKAVRATAPREVAKAPKPEAVPAGRIFVQVGLYGVEANARASAQRMARTGFPTRMGTLTRGGKSYRLVMAGPFASQAEANRAVSAARGAGFKDAYIRK